VFRLPIQRVFSAKGFGTVVTGIPTSGEIRVGDTLQLLPQGLLGKVRGLQAYSEGADSARAGHSCAVNLSDVDHKSVTRGNVLATPGYYRGVSMLGATLRALPGLNRAVRDRTEVRLHIGTAEHLGELVLLDVAELEPGASALVQLRMQEPVVCAPGDRFIVRLASPAITLGGGVVLEESKHRLKRFKAFVVEQLGRAAESVASPRELLEVTLMRAKDAVQAPEALSVEIKRTRADTERLLNDLKAQGKVRHLGLSRWIHAERLERDLERVQTELAALFAAQEHRERMDVRELRKATRMAADYLDLLLAEGETRGLWTAESGGMIRKAGQRALDPAQQALADAALSKLLAARFQTPSPAELAPLLGAAEKPLLAVLERLSDRGELIFVTREFALPKSLYEEARQAIVANCQAHGSLDIPKLRDTLGTSRKWIIPLLEHFDTAGLTLRQGANRVLRKRSQG
jgi:selenocysteine-specific elongation factor